MSNALIRPITPGNAGLPRTRRIISRRSRPCSAPSWSTTRRSIGSRASSSPIISMTLCMRRIYEATAKLILSGKRATPITLKTFFQADAPAGELTVPQYLGRLAANATTIINAEDYGRTVYDLACAASSSISARRWSTPPSIRRSTRHRGPDRGGRAAALRAGRDRQIRPGFEPFTTALTDAIDMAANAYRRDGGLSGLATGFADLDQKMGGLHPSDLIILAGRPVHGQDGARHQHRLHVAAGLSRKARRSDDPRSTARWSASSRSKCRPSSSPPASSPSRPISRRSASAAATSMRERVRPIRRRQPGAPAPAASSSTTRRHHRRRAAHPRAAAEAPARASACIVVDYLQLMPARPGRAQENRVQEISEITRGLKALAKELDVPVLALSQLSAPVEQREDKRPQLADLRESGSIEQDADVVMFVYREEYYLERRATAREHRRAHEVAGRDGAGDRQGRGDHRQAASRSHGHGDAPLHAGIHEVQQSRRGGAPAGAAGVTARRPLRGARASASKGRARLAILTIDLDALAANYRRLRALCRPGRMRRRGQGRCLWARRGAVAPALCARRLQHLLRRDAWRGRARSARSCRCDHLCLLPGSCRARPRSIAPPIFVRC